MGTAAARGHHEHGFSVLMPCAVTGSHALGCRTACLAWPAIPFYFRAYTLVTNLSPLYYVLNCVRAYVCVRARARFVAYALCLNVALRLLCAATWSPAQSSQSKTRAALSNECRVLPDHVNQSTFHPRDRRISSILFCS